MHQFFPVPLIRNLTNFNEGNIWLELQEDSNCVFIQMLRGTRLNSNSWHHIPTQFDVKIKFYRKQLKREEGKQKHEHG